MKHIEEPSVIKENLKIVISLIIIVTIVMWLSNIFNNRNILQKQKNNSSEALNIEEIDTTSSQTDTVIVDSSYHYKSESSPKQYETTNNDEVSSGIDLSMSIVGDLRKDYNIKSVCVNSFDKAATVNGRIGIGYENIYIKLDGEYIYYEINDEEKTVGIPIEGVYYKKTVYNLLEKVFNKVPNSYTLTIYISPNKKYAVLTGVQSNSQLIYNLK